ncbi:MAG: MATE family efflux transporter, partial [bacterium]|nr:MATE family efflux transporter [bacterium]
MNRKILQIAIPSIVSNITVPLLGLVDVAIVGHLGATAYIGAIAVGGMLFSMLYWLFAFLRMGTSGMTAQAYGRRDLQEVLLVWERALTIGLGIALIMILLQEPILQGAFSWIEATEKVKAGAARYFRICVWGAPAVLGLYALSGWFIGMQNTRLPMLIAIVQNLVNIASSLCFVFLLHMKIEGVALGTLLAQYTGFLLGLGLWLRYYGRLRGYQQGKSFWQAAAMRRFFLINRDIFLRTLCLVGVTTCFTSAGARQGEVILAVNTLLMQLFTIYSYFMDGFAYAGEALGGRFIGAQNTSGLRRCVRLLFAWGIGLAIGFTLLY